MTDYVYLWEYRVSAAAVAAFKRAYGADGPWVRLFAAQRGYLGTELLQDANDPQRFVTLDRWRSRQDYERFHAAHRDAFQRIDAECERLTEEERLLGRFGSEACGPHRLGGSSITSDGSNEGSP